jgi:hypothetical protein
MEVMKSIVHDEQDTLAALNCRRSVGGIFDVLNASSGEL